MTDDDQLMVRIQAGDSSAFNELVERYQGPLIGFFFRNVRDRQLCEDLSQETLLRVYNQSWDYLPSGRFRGWIYRIARNLLIDSVRRQSHDALVHAFTRTHDGESDAINRLTANIAPPEELADQRELARFEGIFIGLRLDGWHQCPAMYLPITCRSAFWFVVS